MTDPIAAPFPWFGGKRKVASLVWDRFGAVQNYVEPFFGSGAVLLGRPQPVTGNETVNDLDGFVCNTWRALAHDPEAVAAWCHPERPIHECDLHARHSWLIQRKDSLVAKLEADPDYHDARIAGYWLWGMACWIGSGFCAAEGPWQVQETDEGPQLLNVGPGGTTRKRPHLGDDGQGIHRQLPHLGNDGRGWQDRADSLLAYFAALQDRMHRVRICCGDWSRVLGESVTVKHGLTAVFLDPPYTTDGHRTADLYAQDSGTVAADVRAWCLANGHHRLLRIALCGYAGEGHEVLTAHGWSEVEWNAGAGYGGQHKGSADGFGHQGRRERIWFSPGCRQARAPGLFD